MASLPEMTEGAPARGLAGAALFVSFAAAAVEPPPEPTLPPFVPPAVPFQLPRIATPPTPPTVTMPLVRDVVFRGNTVVATAELQAIAAPYIGRAADAAAIEDLHQRITRLYVERGYVNSGALLASAGSDGVLAYEIVEGRLSAVRLRGLDDLDERYVVQRLARDTDGPFNVDILRERFQLLLGDPLFTRMNARLVPGERPAEAILDVDIERARAYQISAYANNHRPPSIGSTAVGLRGWRRNLTGWGDVIEGSIEDSAKWDSGIRLSMGARVPVNARGTVMSAQYDRGRSSVVEEPLAVLGIKSLLESADVGVSHTWRETLATRHTTGANFVVRENRTWLLGIPFSFVPGDPDGRIRTATARVWQEYTLRSEREALVARLSASVTRNDLEELEPASESQPHRRYHLWLAQAQYARRLTDWGVQLALRATVQHTKHRLLALDGIPLGGASSVRGFRENQLIRDTVRIFNLEVEVPVLSNAERALQVSVAPFYDYGHGKSRTAGAATLSSWGVAARARWSRFNATLAVARRVAQPDAVRALKGDLQDHGVHFDVAYNFF